MPQAVSFHSLVQLGTRKMYNSCETDLTIKAFMLPHSMPSLIAALFIINFLYHIIVRSIKYTHFISIFKPVFIPAVNFFIGIFSYVFIYPFIFHFSKSLFSDVSYVAYSHFLLHAKVSFFY